MFNHISVHVFFMINNSMFFFRISIIGSSKFSALILFFLKKEKIMGQIIFNNCKLRIKSKQFNPLFFVEKQTIRCTKIKNSNTNIFLVSTNIIVEKKILVKRSVVNLHFSGLPSWRGANPLINSLYYNNKKVFLSLIKTGYLVDVGGIYSSCKFHLFKYVSIIFF